MNAYEALTNIINNEIKMIVPRFILDHLRDDHDFVDCMYNNFETHGEPLIFYFVSKWLGRRLLNKSELVYYCDNSYIWGCTQYGQSLIYHSTIIEITNDLFLYEQSQVK